MAYENKHTFKDGDILYAAQLNHINDQVEQNANHNHDNTYDAKGAAATATANANVYTNDIAAQLAAVIELKADGVHEHDASDITLGTLPIKHGGTGADNSIDARYAMNFIGKNPLSSSISGATVAHDTPNNWINIGAGYAYIGDNDQAIITDFPTDFGCFLQNFVYGNFVYQIVHPLTIKGTIYHRGGSKDQSWYGSWVAEAPADHNHNDQYYTESEIDTKLNKKSNIDHTHTLGENPLTTYIKNKDNKTATSKDDTPANWVQIGVGLGYLGQDDRNIITNFPIANYGCHIQNYVYNGTVYQTIYPQTKYGTIYHRAGGQTSGWYGTWNKITQKAPRLTDAQKQQLKKLIDDYWCMGQSLFHYTGAARRGCYAHNKVLTTIGYSHEKIAGCVYQFAGSSTTTAIKNTFDAYVNDKDNPITTYTIKSGDYYKYMLNCGLFCQMIWMGRPITDFITSSEGGCLVTANGSLYDSKKLLDYVNEGTKAPAYHALKAKPSKLTTNADNPIFNSVFVVDGVEWGYYFKFDLAKRAYGVKKSSGDYYIPYNGYYKYNGPDTDISVTDGSGTGYTSTKEATGKVKGYASTNQVLVNSQFILKVTSKIDAGTNIKLGTIKSYKPDNLTPITVHHGGGKRFYGYITSDGVIYVSCTTDLPADTHYVWVNGTYIPSVEVEPDITQVPLGFDGASSMAEELYALGCEVPYDEIDVGDLVFFRVADVSEDNRNPASKTNDDALMNRAYRNISHVGIVYDFDNEGFPIIADCTDYYAAPNCIGKTSLGNTSSTFSRVKAAHERNTVVMVARHPAAFGFSRNMPNPKKFSEYRGTKTTV